MTTEFIQKATGLPEGTIVKVMDSFVEFVKASLLEGNQVEMKNFGVFSFKDLPERPGRNPHANVAITLSAKRSPSFKYSKKFVDSVQPSVSAIPTVTPPSAPPSAPPVMPMTPPPLVSKNWYLADAAGAFSEVPEHELKAKGLNASSMLWSAETDWKKATDIPALAYLLP
ncbi:HU family DNA-binding protein [Microcoleus sp. A006_D1]|uniref:HU family DNA-binding protein n=1 Tax=Microcoleus sp. A006_D1 TaxID=3055267 RepID=UPI002FD3C1E3